MADVLTRGIAGVKTTDKSEVLQKKWVMFSTKAWLIFLTLV